MVEKLVKWKTIQNGFNSLRIPYNLFSEIPAEQNYHLSMSFLKLSVPEVWLWSSKLTDITSWSTNIFFSTTMQPLSKVNCLIHQFVCVIHKRATYSECLKSTVPLSSSFSNRCSGKCCWYCTTWGLSSRFPKRFWMYLYTTLGFFTDCQHTNNLGLHQWSLYCLMRNETADMSNQEIEMCGMVKLTTPTAPSPKRRSLSFRQTATGVFLLDSLGWKKIVDSSV